MLTNYSLWWALFKFYFFCASGEEETEEGAALLE